MIRVVVDDLAFIPVDAVLRPADENLDPVSAQEAQLDRVAGAAFAAQRRVQAPLDIGAATVTDDCDTGLSAVIGGDVVAAAPGVYVVAYDVTDSQGNPAQQVIRVVQVRDTTVPTISWWW